MQLSAQLFADIVGDEAVALASSAVADERRQSPRANLGRRARIYPLIETSSDRGQPVLVRDISVHGIGMLIGEPMTPGDEFVIHLPTATASSLEEPVQIQCAVRRCQVGGSGQTQFLVGSTFELVLNRPMDYAVELPKEVSDEQQQEVVENAPEEQWDTLSPSPVEGRFDEQLAEAMANRPQRWSIRESLNKFRLTRWAVELLRRWLAPLIDLMRRLGIRNRLTRSEAESRKIELLVETTEATAGETDAAETAVPFRERRLITALDSASHYSPNGDPLSETSPAYTSAATSSRRSSLFAHDDPGSPTPPAIPPVIPLPTQTDATIEPPSIASPAAAELPSSAPPVIPAFELPAVLPLEAALSVEGVPPSAAAVTPGTTLDVPIPLPVQPTLSVPAEAQSKDHKVAAWRGRHRLGWHEVPRNRPRLGR